MIFNRKKGAVLTAALALPLLSLGAAVSSTPAEAAGNTVTGKCSDYKPDNNAVLLCNLGLKPKPQIPAPDAPETPATTCADWAPDNYSVLLCNLGMKQPPAAPIVVDPVDPSDPVDPEQPTTDDCGPIQAKPGGGSWECTFVDDFTASELDRSKWVPQTNFSNGNPNGNYACYIDDPAVVSQSAGTLKLSVKKMPAKVDCPGQLADSDYAAGQISTFYKFSQQYGKFEARVKNQAFNKPGLQEAFWLWPDVRYHSTANWPISGEIDIVETYSQHPNLAIPFFHYSADLGGPQPGLNTAWDCVANRGEWNTYTLEWGPNRLEVFVNGDSCLVNTSGDQAFKKKYIVALTAALGTGANSWDGAAGDLPATMEVDYVKVWK